MRAIPNQPFIFAEQNGLPPFPSENNRRLNQDPGECVRLFVDDTIYIQFEREVTTKPVKPDLIEATEALNLVGDPSMDIPALWNAAGGWVVGSGKAVQTGAATSDLDTSVPIVGLKPYILRFTVSNISGATITPYLGSVDPGNIGTAVSANGTYEMEMTRTAGFFGALVFRCTGGDATIDDVELFRKLDTTVTPLNGWDWDPNEWLYDNQGIKHKTGNTGSLHFDGLTTGSHYRLTLEFEESDTGYITVKNDTTFLNIANTKRIHYFFVAESTEFNLEPSSDFTGNITSALFQAVDFFNRDDGWKILYNSEADVTSFDLTDFIVYDDQWATLKFVLNDDTHAISNGCGNFSLYKIEATVAVETYQSNCFSKTANNGAYQLIKGTCDCTGLGFNFNNFILQQRLELDFTNPEYPIKKIPRPGSDGSKNLVYSERDKTWTVRTDHLDETAHDFLSTVLICDKIEIDDREYVFDDRDYKVAWPEEGTDLSAPAKFKLTEKISTIYNLNQGCGFNGHEVKVLLGWADYSSYKMLDHFNIALTDSMIIRVDKFEINGVDQISEPQRYIITRDGLGVYTPDLILANGINGNWSDIAANSTFPQNGDEFINGLSIDKSVIFHDGLSVIEIAPGTTFVLDISMSYSVQYMAGWARRRYTEAGMALPNVSLTPLYTYGL